MKITDRHVKVFTIVMFVIAIGLFVYLPFIGIKRQLTNTTKQLLSTEESSPLSNTRQVDEMSKGDLGQLTNTEQGNTPFKGVPEQMIDTERVNKPFKSDLDQMKQRKIIRALVVYNKTDFFFFKRRYEGNPGRASA